MIQQTTNQPFQLDRYLALAKPHDRDGREQAHGWLAWLDYQRR
jgi:hypothetical protein